MYHECIRGMWYTHTQTTRPPVPACTTPLSVPTAPHLLPHLPLTGPHTSQSPAALSFPLYTSPPPFPSLPWERSPGTGQGELARGLSVQGFPDFLVPKTEPRNTA